MTLSVVNLDDRKRLKSSFAEKNRNGFTEPTEKILNEEL